MPVTHSCSISPAISWFPSLYSTELRRSQLLPASCFLFWKCPFGLLLGKGSQPFDPAAHRHSHLSHHLCFVFADCSFNYYFAVLAESFRIVNRGLAFPYQPALIVWTYRPGLNLKSPSCWEDPMVYWRLSVPFALVVCFEQRAGSRCLSPRWVQWFDFPQISPATWDCWETAGGCFGSRRTPTISSLSSICWAI